MSVADYYPNTANCGGYEYLTGTVPPSLRECGDALSGAQNDSISADDENYVVASVTYGNQPGHRLRFKVTQNRLLITQLDVTLKGWGHCEGGDDWSAYIWNSNTADWEFITNHTLGSKQTLTISKNSNITYYVDADGYLDVFVGATTTPDGFDAHADIYFAHLAVTHIVGTTHSVAGTITAQSTVAAAASVIWGAVGAIAAAGTVAGAILATWGAAGVISGTSGVDAAASVTWRAQGTIAVVSTLSGTVNPTVYCSGQIAAHAAVSGAASVTYGAVGSVAAASGMSGAASVLRSVVGSISAVCTLTGRITSPLAGTIAAHCTVSGTLSREMPLAGSIAAVCAVSALPLIRFWYPYLSLPDPEGIARRISWHATENVLIIIDGEVWGESAVGYVDLDSDTRIRQYLEIQDQEPLTPHTPLDKVALSWSGDAPTYQIWRWA